MLIMGGVVAVVALIGLVLGGLFLGGVFSSGTPKQQMRINPNIVITPPATTPTDVTVKPPDTNPTPAPVSTDITNLLPNDTQAVVNLNLDAIATSSLKKAALGTPERLVSSSLRARLVFRLTP